jgi:hypothetical protein
MKGDIFEDGGEGGRSRWKEKGEGKVENLSKRSWAEAENEVRICGKMKAGVIFWSLKLPVDSILMLPVDSILKLPVDSILKLPSRFNLETSS